VYGCISYIVFISSFPQNPFPRPPPPPQKLPQQLRRPKPKLVDEVRPGHCARPLDSSKHKKVVLFESTSRDSLSRLFSHLKCPCKNDDDCSHFVNVMFFPRNPVLPLVQTTQSYTVKDFQEPFKELSLHGLVACLTSDTVYFPIVELTEYHQLGHLSPDSRHRIVKSLAPFFQSIFTVPSVLVLSPCWSTLSVLDLRTCLVLLQETRMELSSPQAPFHIKVFLDIEGCPPPKAFQQTLTMYQCSKHLQSPHTCPRCYHTSFDSTTTCNYCWTQFTPAPPPIPPLIPGLQQTLNQSPSETTNGSQPPAPVSYAAVVEEQFPSLNESSVRSKRANKQPPHSKQQQQQHFPPQNRQQQQQPNQNQDLNAQLASLQLLVEDHFKHLCGRIDKLETDANSFNARESRKPHANLMNKIRKLEGDLMAISTKVEQAALPQPMTLTTPSLPLPPCAQAKASPSQEIVNADEDPFASNSESS